MAISIIRFWSYGWIELLYLNPKFHFKYFGFEWVNVYGNITYLIFLLCLISAVFVALGYRYKLSIVTFFLTFTYIELMDKTTYLNHYYFISSLSFLMCFLPAGKYFSLDSYFSKKNLQNYSKMVHWLFKVIYMSYLFFCRCCETEFGLAIRGSANFYMVQVKIWSTCYRWKLNAISLVSLPC